LEVVRGLRHQVTSHAVRGTMTLVAQVLPLPSRGEIYVDARGEGRALRVSWHHDEDTVVLSLWRGALCAGSFRLRTEDVPGLINTLVRGLSEGYAPVANGGRHAG